jgi:hypothetical protein
MQGYMAAEQASVQVPAQNLCPAAVIDVPQLGQKPIPVAISISVQRAGGIVIKVRLRSRRRSALGRNPVHSGQPILIAGTAGLRFAWGALSSKKDHRKMATGRMRSYGPNPGILDDVDII